MELHALEPLVKSSREKVQNLKTSVWRNLTEHRNGPQDFIVKSFTV